MNKKLYIVHEAGNWGKRVAKGLSQCKTEGSVYSFCVSQNGLGVEHKSCQKEFKALLECIKTKR